MSSATLFAEQAELQAAADRLVAALHLNDLLERIGRPVRVGSSAMGLMVRRDIDITVICPDLGPDRLAAFADIGADLMRHTDCVSAVRFRNDSGQWNIDRAAYPDGFYLGLVVRDTEGLDWSFDIWAVDEPERQPDLRHLETLLPRLTDTHRQSILGIKHAIADRPAEPKVPSAWVYEAVVDHGVEGIKAFKIWLDDGRNDTSRGQH